ncbi:MAG: hypothetical protein U1A22_04020 [Xanthomonadaceae bacterium]|nr:hypothetical protein [Xanthomonadaceae bacterium]
MNRWIFALVQFFPLSFFATYAFWHGAPTNDRWVESFQLAALAGLIQLAIVFPQSRPANRLVLAGNLYLIFGGLATITHQWWLLHVYDLLRESAIFIFMTVVGIVATFATSAGFIGMSSAPLGRVRTASYWLLGATVLALPISFAFSGNRAYAAVLPIIVLAVLQRYLVFRVQRSSQCNG